MKEKPKPVYKFISVIYILLFFSVLFYFLWKPLLIVPILLFSGYGATYLRSKLIYSHTHFRPIILGLVWGAIFAFGLYYLNNLLNSPLWWRLVTYLIGFYPVGYIGYRDLIETEILKNTKYEAFTLASQFASIVMYILSLLFFILHH